MSLTILIHVNNYVYKDFSLENDNSIVQPWKDISLKNDKDQHTRAGACKAPGGLARSAKNNLIDGLFSFSHLQNVQTHFHPYSMLFIYIQSYI